MRTKSHQKTILPRIFPYLLIYQFISKAFASRKTNIYQQHNPLENILTISNFGSTFVATIVVNNYNEAETSPGIICTDVSFSFLWQFFLILQHLFMGYVLSHCNQAADMGVISPFSWRFHMDLGYPLHKAALLKLEAAQWFFSNSFQFCWIWCEQLAINRPNEANNGLKIANSSQFFASNLSNSKRNRVKIKQYLNNFEFQLKSIR